MTKHEFVPGFEFECLVDIVSIVRSGEVAAKKWELIQHASWFCGCAAAKLDGNEDPVPIGTQPSYDMAALSVEQLADEVEKLTRPAFGATPAKLDLATIMIIINLVSEIIKRLS